MADNDWQPREPTPWDRVGGFLQDMSTVGQTMANRNLRLWADVSQHMRKEEYTADDLAKDARALVNATMVNLQDGVSFLTRGTQREAVASTLPTAFLFFPRKDDEATAHDPADPVWMRVPFEDVEQLPSRAQLEFTEGDPEGRELLSACLRADLGPARQAYLLTPYGITGLKPGVYSGLAFITRPTVRPVATLKILVQGPDQGSPEPEPQSAA